MIWPRWPRFPFSVEWESNSAAVGSEECGRPWEPEVWGQRPAGEGGWLVRGHMALAPQLGGSARRGQARGGEVCAAFPRVPLGGGWRCRGSMGESGALALARLGPNCLQAWSFFYGSQLTPLSGGHFVP